MLRFALVTKQYWAAVCAEKFITGRAESNHFASHAYSLVAFLAGSHRTAFSAISSFTMLTNLDSTDAI